MNYRTIPKPEAGEFAPYASMYNDLVPNDGLVLEHLAAQAEELRALIEPLDEDKLLYRYEPGKWTIKEMLVHMLDDERVFTYRALRYARGDVTPLPGFEQDDYASLSYANERSIESIMGEYNALRPATLALFNGFDDRVLEWRGEADGQPLSVRGAIYHLAGHELHHLKILRQRYL